MMKSLNKRYRNIPQHKVTCDRPISSVQWLSRVWLFATPWITARQASLSITNSRSSLRLTSIESVIPSSHLILCCPLLLLPSIPPSIRVFSNESALRMKWPKYWSFSFSISPSQEIPELISFRMDWLDLLAVQGTLKSLLQHHSSKASIRRRSAFFTVHLSFPLGLIGLISLQSKRLSRVFSNTTVEKHQFFSAQLSLQSNSHIYPWLLERPQLWLHRPLLQNNVSAF